MKVLITGGAGFIGSNLCRRLSQSQHIAGIRVLDDLSTGSLANLEGIDLDFSEASIVDFDAVRDSARGVDAIVHLGANASVPWSIDDPQSAHEVNATGTLHVLEAARILGVGQVIVASSSAVYGPNPSVPVNEDAWTVAMSPYAASKQATESYALAYQHSYKLRTVAFRFFNVYGPAQPADHPYAAVIPKFLDAAISGRPLNIHGDGTQSRDFTYVDTVCEVIEQALTQQMSLDRPLNLAFSTRTDLLTLIEELERVLDHPLDRVFTAPVPGEVKASQADSTQLRAVFPQVEPVDLRTGLSWTADWFKQQDSYSYNKGRYI